MATPLTDDVAVVDGLPGPQTPIEKIWSRLVRPFDPGEVGEALLGISADAIHEFADVVVCAGDEATELIEIMPKLIRRLRVGDSQRNERCAEGIRGPVLWSETAAARSSSFGNEGIFVCSIPGRDYDVVENRLLVSALETIVRAGRRVHARYGHDHSCDTQMTRVVGNTDLAARYLSHRALAQVQSGTRGQRRSLRAIASGRNATIYRPAVAVIEKAAEPFEVADLLAFDGNRSGAHHQLLAAALDAIEHSGRRLPGLRMEAGALILGPYEYLHPGVRVTGGSQIGVLRNDHTLMALDPSRSGTDCLAKELIGPRVVEVVTTASEMAHAIARSWS